VLPRFTGTAVHDAWAPYDNYRQITHALCDANWSPSPNTTTTTRPPPASNQAVGRNKSSTPCSPSKTSPTASIDPVPPETLAHHQQAIIHAAHIGVTDSPQGKVGNKHRALARRLIRRIEDYLRFAADPIVPGTTTRPNEKSACPNSGRKSPAACAH